MIIHLTKEEIEFLILVLGCYQDDRAEHDDAAMIAELYQKLEEALQ